ncbi:MAG: hypothetical protein ACP6IP_04630 [Candidatus Njordarchaeia archaeon]
MGKLNFKRKLKSFKRAAKEFLFGLFLYELYYDTLKYARKYKDAINLFIIGELLGLPLMDTYLSLRLLPYLLPEIGKWKFRQLRESDITDEVPDI